MILIVVGFGRGNLYKIMETSGKVIVLLCRDLEVPGQIWGSVIGLLRRWKGKMSTGGFLILIRIIRVTMGRIIGIAVGVGVRWNLPALRKDQYISIPNRLVSKNQEMRRKVRGININLYPLNIISDTMLPTDTHSSHNPNHNHNHHHNHTNKFHHTNNHYQNLIPNLYYNHNLI